ncbi:DUF1643 domain-containing protein [Nostoc sp. FACHB-145]|uniref:DUF1643 domain-containing protein n=1 Tax=Nostoc sp. FACHB-145 TaxID=2692836 RepID=UPI001689DF78|nr:DUF1643 domain-containing protein [Nostoc sp. FACHB-145]MBD2471715.1 DUF1643 domain-containing protein [Nostoc sp. FACHB-145]
MEKTAISDGNYRYLLRREWDVNHPQITFIMLNPSIADDKKDDPTIRKCIKFANLWGYGSLEVVNLFAYRATKPRDMRQVSEPIGLDNNFYLLKATERAKLVILAWGIHGSFLNRDQAVLSLLSNRQPLYCLGRTKAGQPRHPLWLSSFTQPVIF